MGFPADKFIVHPPNGAGFASLTVPTDVPPPPMVDGASVRLVTVTPVTVRLAVAPELPAVAVIRDVNELPISFAVMLKLAAVAPAATVTVGGRTT